MKNDNKIKYEPEADVLSWEIDGDAPIEYANENGNVIVHFTEFNEPVLVEILQASSFISQAEKLVAGSKLR